MSIRTVAATLAAALLVSGQAAYATTAGADAGPRLPRTERATDKPIRQAPRAALTIRVGPTGDVPTIAQAARMAVDGDTVEVQAGEYRGDVATWPQKSLTIRAVGGRARLVADGKAAGGKGIWVIRDGEFLVEGFDFEGARVSDRNGAGIRFEGGKLTVRESRFIGNENGILTGNDGRSELVIERCMFSGNGHGDGQSHNLYVGKIDRLVVRGSYFRAARVGHLLKSRARVSEVTYNRLTDEEGGRASYELEFPAGGRVIAIGNLVEQGRGTENSTIVSYGAEGYRWEQNVLVFVHNTVVNRRPGGGIFVKARSGGARVLLANNVFSGKGDFALAAPSEERGNFTPPLGAFVNPDVYDFRPRATAAFAGRAAQLEDGEWNAYRPTHQYLHERQLKQLRGGAPLTPGAFQPEP